MKNSKRLAAFLLVAALMAGLFAGCGSTDLTFRVRWQKMVLSHRLKPVT